MGLQGRIAPLIFPIGTVGMTAITRDTVRGNSVVGPFGRKFSRETWMAALSDPESDTSFVRSGLFIADLLDAMRPHAAKAPDHTFSRALVAIANNEVAAAHLDLMDSVKDHATPHGIRLEALLRAKNSTTGATLVELTDALGDSFVYPLREVVDRSVDVSARPSNSEWKRAINLAIEESTVCNRWYLAWYFWMDVLWLDANLLQEGETTWRLGLEPSAELMRQLGSWRRTKLIESHFATTRKVEAFGGADDKTARVAWVGDRCVLRADKVRLGELPWRARVRSHATIPETVISPELLNIPLRLPRGPVLVGEAIIILATLQSLFFVLLDLFPRRQLMRETNFREALRIGTDNLSNVLSELTNLPRTTIEWIVDVMTFAGEQRQILWTAPFVRAGIRDRFIFMPGLKGSLLRAINDFIDSYADEASIKGIYFQEHLRHSMDAAIRRGPLARAAWIAPRAVDTPVGDIDICFAVGSALVLCEAKYVGNAVDAFEYFRSGERLDEAVGQINRKLEYAKADLDGFCSFLNQRYGFASNRVSDVIPLVVTSDSFHVGVPRAGVAVADLAMLLAFLTNETPAPLILPKSKQGGRSIYDNHDEAISSVRSYLYGPPDVKEMLASRSARHIDYPTGAFIAESEVHVLVETVDFV